MSKRAAASIGVAVVLLAVLGACVFADSWTGMDELHQIPFNGTDGYSESIYTNDIADQDHIKTNSLNYKVFEQYGPLLIILALLMFGAMVGGICVAREEDETDDTD